MKERRNANLTTSVSHEAVLHRNEGRPSDAAMLLWQVQLAQLATAEPCHSDAKLAPSCQQLLEDKSSSA